MRWYQAAAIAAMTQHDNGRIINLKRKLAKSIRRVWQLSPHAQSAFQFQSCHIGNNMVIIYGKRHEGDCQIIAYATSDGFRIESSSNFSEFETENIIKTLSYNLPSCFDLADSQGKNLVRGMEYAIAWIT